MLRDYGLGGSPKQANMSDDVPPLERASPMQSGTDTGGTVKGAWPSMGTAAVKHACHKSNVNELK